MICHYLKGAGFNLRQEMRAWIKEHCWRPVGKSVIHFLELPNDPSTGSKRYSIIAWFNDDEDQEALEFKLIYSEFISRTANQFAI